MIESKGELGVKYWLMLFLVMTNVFVWIGYLKYYVGTVALLRYIQIKNYTPPSEQEIKACSKYASERIIKLLCNHK